MNGPTDHDAYIDAAPEPFQPALRRLRAILTRVLAEAEEIVAYNMPGFPDRRLGRRELRGIQQAMRPVRLSRRHLRARNRHSGRRPQGDEDRHHLLAAQADSG